MSDSKTTDAANDDHVGTEDPELEELLKFEPAPRQNKRRDGWTAALQRRFIAELARSGSPTLAAEAVGKNRYGVEKVYKSPGADGFRAAWDSAVALFEERVADRVVAQHADRGATRPPFVDRRRARGAAQAEPEPEPEVSEDQKWDLIHNIGVKFMRKVAAEREARLNGEIVAADFYLRQITLEVTFDLTASQFGWDAREALKELRRGEHSIMKIVSTDLADWLDASRRLWWAHESEPERPPHPDVRFLKRHSSSEGQYATNVDQHAYGALTTPARGYSQEEWARMNTNEQVAARERQFAEDAEEQRAWEARARAEWEASE